MNTQKILPKAQLFQEKILKVTHFKLTLFFGFSSISVANDIALVKQILEELEYDAGIITCKYGTKTKSVLQKLYDDHGELFDGKLIKNEINDLKTALRFRQAQKFARKYNPSDNFKFIVPTTEMKRLK